MVRGHGDFISVEPHTLPKYAFRHPGVGRLRGREHTRIDPHPEEESGDGNETPPLQPHAAPNRQYEQRQNRYARPPSPGIGVAFPRLLVYSKYRRDPAREGHRMKESFRE